MAKRYFIIVLLCILTRRYFELKDIIIRIDAESTDDLKALMPTISQETSLKTLLSSMKKFNSVMLALQRPTCSLLNAHVLFDKLIEVRLDCFVFFVKYFFSDG
jgi:hypothetical protein